MCAATSQMVAKVAELMELRKMIEDLNAEVRTPPKLSGKTGEVEHRFR